MAEIDGAIEFREDDKWYSLINLSPLLMDHSDLSGCLFGIDNYAGFAPLFADRGLPSDCSDSLRAEIEKYGGHAECPSWALWSEIKRVNWDEPAVTRDRRISQFIQEGDQEVYKGKWLGSRDWAWVREALDQDENATVRSGAHIFRRLLIKRADALDGTKFPLVMKLMSTLAERFCDEGVRMTVWFS